MPSIPPCGPFRTAFKQPTIQRGGAAPERPALVQSQPKFSGGSVQQCAWYRDPAESELKDCECDLLFDNRSSQKGDGGSFASPTSNVLTAQRRTMLATVPR